MVFDAAASYKSTSLNDQLVSRPCLLNNLVGVVLRFRLQEVAITADIQAMFHQVRVTQQDQTALRFLYGGDLTVTDHLKSTKCNRPSLAPSKSSPCCASYCLRRTATDNMQDDYQQLWRQQLAWDEPISGKLLKVWEGWREELPELSKSSVPRNYMKGSESLEDAQIHIFADTCIRTGICRRNVGQNQGWRHHI